MTVLRTTSLERSEDPLPPKMHSVVKVRNSLEWQQRRKVVCLKPHALFYASRHQLDAIFLRLLDRCSRWLLQLFQEAGATAIYLCLAHILITGRTCLAEAFYRQVLPFELVRNVLLLCSCPSPASVFRSTLPRLPCIFQPTMYPFIRRHHPCCKLQLPRVRGELALFFKPTKEGAGWVSERCWVCGCVAEMLQRSGHARDYR